VEPGDLLTRLAAAVRDGLDATWVRIFLAGPGSGFEPEPTGLAGSGQGAAAASCELKRADEKLGRIDVGPRRGGNYSEAERVLLNTVASQAAAFVANVRLSAQLARQLDDLTAPHPSLSGLRERRPAPSTCGRPTPHDHVRSDTPSTVPLMPLLRPALLPPPLGAIRLVSS